MGWETLRQPDGQTYYYHAQSGSTAWDWRSGPPPRPPRGSTRQPLPPVLPPAKAASIAKASDLEAGGVRAPSVGTEEAGEVLDDEVCEGNPTIEWTDADWDLILVLPLPEASEERVAQAGAAVVADGKKREKKKKPNAAELSEMRLRQGLRLEAGDGAADGSSSQKSSTDWLIHELKRRVLLSGLECKVLKLMPGSDEAEELVGEYEIESGHNVTLIAIGARKVIGSSGGAPPIAMHVAGANGAEPPPSPPSPPLSPPSPGSCAPSAPPSPPALGANAKHNEAAARLAMRESQGEYFPRLALEAERRQLRLRTRPTASTPAGIPYGLPATFRRSRAASFPPFASSLRQELEMSILEAPLAKGRGAGLRFDQLLGSGRVKELIHVHDDDEVERLFHSVMRSTAGVLPLDQTRLHLLNWYCGPEVSFYFTWVAAYTRSLWIPSVLGVIFYLVLEQIPPVYRTASNATGDAADDAAFADGVITGASNVRPYLLAVYSLVVVVWASGFDEMWKRRQGRLAFYWGEASREKAEPAINASFVGKAVREGFYAENGTWVEMGESRKVPKGARLELDAFTGEKPLEVWFPEEKRTARRWRSTLALLGMAAACVFTVFVLQVLDTALVKAEAPSFISSILTAVAIVVFNAAWLKMALWLSLWENYRLEERYRRMLTYKLVVFQAINSYWALIYIAFIKPHGVTVFGVELETCYRVPPPGGESCSDQLRDLLLSILLTNIVIGQGQELIQPIAKKYIKQLKARCKRRFAGRKTSTVAVTPADGKAAAAPLDLAAIARRKRELKRGESLSPEEENTYRQHQKAIDLIAEYERVPIKSVRKGLGSTFYEYNELVIQYGYIVMFSAAFPLGALLALANNLVEFRSDVVKMIYGARRVKSTRATGIGAWAVVLRCLSVVGIWVNLFYLGITSQFFDELEGSWPIFKPTWVKVVFVVVLEHLLLALKYFVDWLVPDVPSKLKANVARQEYIADAIDD